MGRPAGRQLARRRASGAPMTTSATGSRGMGRISRRGYALRLETLPAHIWHLWSLFGGKPFKPGLEVQKKTEVHVWGFLYSDISDAVQP